MKKFLHLSIFIVACSFIPLHSMELTWCGKATALGGKIFAVAKAKPLIATGAVGTTIVVGYFIYTKYYSTPNADPKASQTKKFKHPNPNPHLVAARINEPLTERVQDVLGSILDKKDTLDIDPEDPMIVQIALDEENQATSTAIPAQTEISKSNYQIILDIVQTVHRKRRDTNRDGQEELNILEGVLTTSNEELTPLLRSFIANHRLRPTSKNELGNLMSLMPDGGSTQTRLDTNEAFAITQGSEMCKAAFAQRRLYDSAYKNLRSFLTDKISQ